jgi:FKBP-type peptidyl-prolyl cis-trans isomerase FkpA
LNPILAGLVLLLAFAAPAAAEENPPPDDVRVNDLEVGGGPEIRRGWFAVMHYTGWVYDGRAQDSRGAQFVSSRERGQPTIFVYGYYRALAGLEKGMRGMKVGGKRTIVVPPSLGYDDLKHPTPRDVPPKSTLIFEVELLDVVPQQAAD